MTGTASLVPLYNHLMLYYLKQDLMSTGISVVLTSCNMCARYQELVYKTFCVKMFVFTLPKLNYKLYLVF